MCNRYDSEQAAEIEMLEGYVRPEEIDRADQTEQDESVFVEVWEQEGGAL